MAAARDSRLQLQELLLLPHKLCWASLQHIALEQALPQRLLGSLATQSTSPHLEVIQTKGLQVVVSQHVNQDCPLGLACCCVSDTRRSQHHHQGCQQWWEWFAAAPCRPGSHSSANQQLLHPQPGCCRLGCVRVSPHSCAASWRPIGCCCWCEEGRVLCVEVFWVCSYRAASAQTQHGSRHLDCVLTGAGSLPHCL